MHQRLVLRLARQLASHMERTGGFEVFADISWGDDTLVHRAHRAGVAHGM